MNIFKALTEDHDRQRAIVKTILDTSGDSPIREEQFAHLKQQLSLHAKAEERHFYAPLMDYDQTIKLSRHGVAEHHQLDKLVAELEEIDKGSPEWLKTFKKLAHKIEHHLEEEEREFFPQAGKALSEGQKQDLAEDYEQEMAEARS